MVKSFSKNQLIGLIILISLALPFVPFLSILDPVARVLLFIAGIWLLVK